MFLFFGILSVLLRDFCYYVVNLHLLLCNICVIHDILISRCTLVIT